MRERRWQLLALYGLLLASAVSGALKATRPKFKIATTSTTTSTTEEPDVADNEDGDNEATTPSSDANATTSRVLTGIPQIDYIWDPNLPRELNGFNLSEYPFYNSIPEEINFKCDGLHDGFYASVAHKCQVYHHCLFGTRYDFLCANFTAFDQRTFICHFASEVDCANSKKYWHRNDALYKAAETTTVSTTSTSTTTPTTTTPAQTQRPIGRRRRPYRRRPAYDYYEEDYYDDEAYERTRPRGYDVRDDYDYDDRKYTRRDRDRDRNFRDRDYREREIPRSRDTDRPLRESDRPIKEEPPLSPRERFPSRNNRRDPVRPAAILPRDPVLDDEPRSRNRDPVLDDEPWSRNRDPVLDDEPRSRNRDPSPPIRAREPPEDAPIEDGRASDSRNRDVDDRRYGDKGYAYDYDEEPGSAGPASSSGSLDVLVKPAAPASSVYARPRAPPKIRRPVPITEQEKFAYKSTTAPPIPAVEARRRPVEVPPEDDYYEDELEEVRPRRPVSRRRPGFRDFYESPRERDRDRPFRMRYRNEGDDAARPRKHPERNRERYYERGPERGRDRSLDRSKDRGNDRMPESTRDRPGGRKQETDRPHSGRPVDREHELERPRSSSRAKEVVEPLETTRRPSIYERTSTTPSTTSTTTTTTTTTTETIDDDVSSLHSADHPFRSSGHRQSNQSPTGRNVPSKAEAQDQEYRDYQPEKERPDPPRSENPPRDEIPAREAAKPRPEAEEYVDEDYDEPEYHPARTPPPRTAVRVVKRPFLPSRGGNPNPRGLSPVGSRAPESMRKDEAPASRLASIKSPHAGVYRESAGKSTDSDDENDRRSNYDAYKVVQKDIAQKTRSEDYEEVAPRPSTRRPVDHPGTSDHLPIDKDRPEPPTARTSSEDDGNAGGSSSRHGAAAHGRYADDQEATGGREKSTLKWNSEQLRTGQRGDVRHGPEPTQSVTTGSQNRPKSSRPSESSGYYESSSYGSANTEREQQPILTTKQTLNEVATHHRLQDIPESEYDVTLNEALTPSFNNQEANLPSGFVLPIHRQLPREPILQSTENTYKVSRPYNQPIITTSTQQQQQKPFVPSPQFLPLGPNIGSTNGNERSRSVQYFRTPETVHVTGTQYRHQRGPWQDYTGY